VLVTLTNVRDKVICSLWSICDWKLRCIFLRLNTVLTYRAWTFTRFKITKRRSTFSTTCHHLWTCFRRHSASWVFCRSLSMRLNMATRAPQFWLLCSRYALCLCNEPANQVTCLLNICMTYLSGISISARLATICTWIIFWSSSVVTIILLNIFSASITEEQH